MNAEEITQILNRMGPAWTRRNRQMILGWLREAYTKFQPTPKNLATLRTIAPGADPERCDVFEIVLDEAIRSCEAEAQACCAGRSNHFASRS